VQVSEALPSTTAILALGLLPAEIVLGPPCILLVTPILFPAPPYLLFFPAGTNGAGVGSVGLAVPPEPSLAGVPLYWQYAVVDAAGGFAGLSFTSGLRTVLNTD
jgi:hypothetical protein